MEGTAVPLRADRGDVGESVSGGNGNASVPASSAAWKLGAWSEEREAHDVNADLSTALSPRGRPTTGSAEGSLEDRRLWFMTAA